jgi:hypothetical protein
VDKDAGMLIPVIIFVASMTAGVVVAAHWLPDLAAGSVGGLAFFAVCGLVGAATGVFGLHIYSIVEDSGLFGPRAEFIASDLQVMAVNVGSLLGFAGIVYLLAPAPELDPELEAVCE